MNKRALTFDDIQILPKYSEINSRSTIDTSSILAGDIHLKMPFVSAPMDTVTGSEMCLAMANKGGFGILHRFGDSYKLMKETARLFVDNEMGLNFGVSIGVNESEEELDKLLCHEYSPRVVLIDIAHGHCSKMKDRLRLIKSKYIDKLVIAGNVCTSDGAMFLQDNGADAVRCGIGNGSVCSTRENTGIGVPQLSAIENCVRGLNIPLIADGGIRKGADVVKALAFGADTVMLGGLLAGTKESPGECFFLDGISRKKYRGSASRSCKVDNALEDKNVEGVEIMVPYKGIIDSVLDPLMDGLRSGMSYLGARDISNMRDLSFVEVTVSGVVEASTHGVMI